MVFPVGVGNISQVEFDVEQVMLSKTNVVRFHVVAAVLLEFRNQQE